MEKLKNEFQKLKMNLKNEFGKVKLLNYQILNKKNDVKFVSQIKTDENLILSAILSVASKSGILPSLLVIPDDNFFQLSPVFCSRVTDTFLAGFPIEVSKICVVIWLIKIIYQYVYV